MARSILCGKEVVVCVVVVVMSGWVGSVGTFADAASEIEQAKVSIASLLSGGDVAGADAVLEGLLALADSEAKGRAVQQIGAAYKGAKQYSKAILLAEYVLEKWPGAELALKHGLPGEGACTATVKYSDVEGGEASVSVGAECTLNWGDGNIDADPNFTDSTNDDYHLKSQAGRWDPNTQSWTQDGVTSPRIDAGDPGCPFGDELVRTIINFARFNALLQNRFGLGGVHRQPASALLRMIRLVVIARAATPRRFLSLRRLRLLRFARNDKPS